MSYPVLIITVVALLGLFGLVVYYLQQRAGRRGAAERPTGPCVSHTDWETVMVEMARDGAEAVDLDRCARCGAFRLSWWWPKDSADTTLQSECPLSAVDAESLRCEADWAKRRVLFQDILQRLEARRQ